MYVPQDIIYEIAIRTHPIVIWRIYNEKDYAYSFTQLLLISIIKNNNLNDYFRSWCCDTAYVKMKPDPLRSKYNLFQNDVPTEFRIFAWNNLQLPFTSQAFLAKAIRINDHELVEYILNSEMAWCSESHILAILKSGSYTPYKALSYTYKYRLWCPNILNLAHITEDHHYARFGDAGISWSTVPKDILIGRGILTDLHLAKKYVQQCAIQENNLELFLNPCYIEGNELTREQVLLCKHKSHTILQYLRYTKEELDTLKLLPPDTLKSLKFVKYLRDNNSIKVSKYKQCNYILDSLDGIACDMPKNIKPEVVMYAHRHGVLINQHDINKAFIITCKQDSYRPDIIYYLYPYCSLDNKKELALEVATGDDDLSEWLIKN